MPVPLSGAMKGINRASAIGRHRPGLAIGDVGAWIGIMVAAGTPKPVIDRLSAALHTIMQSTEVRERLTGVGLEINYLGADDFAKYLKEQQTRFADIIKRGSIKVD